LRDGYRSGVPEKTFERLSLPFGTEAGLQVVGNMDVSFWKPRRYPRRYSGRFGVRLQRSFRMSTRFWSRVRRGRRAPVFRIHMHMIRKLKSGEYRLYSRKKSESTGKRRNLGTFTTLEKARQHEREVQFFKKH
jgi:hypothetical protein